MPVYTYECEECGVRFNKKQSFSDAPVEVCPECSGHTHKVIGPVGVVFKGSGFYVTDSRSNRNNMNAPAKKKDGESESKPAEAKDSTASSEKDAAKPEKAEKKATKSAD